MFNQRNRNDDATYLKKSDIEKRTKIKITNDFIVNKKMMNAKIFKKDENSVQLILYRRVVNELFKNNH